MNLRSIVLVVVVLWSSGRASSLWAGEFDLSQHSIPVHEIYSGGPAKDGIPALVQPPFVPADQATFLRGDDRVVGVAIDGVAKAYPIRILNWHEVINDTVGDRPVAVTWCPLTQSAVTFDRRVGSAVSTFGVSGRLYNSNVLLYDHQTESLWSQLHEAAVTGSRTGTTLTPIASQLTAWSEWREAYPNTLVLSARTGYRRDYTRDPYAQYRREPGTMFRVQPTDTRLSAKTIVLGAQVNGVAKAYPLAHMSSSEGLEDTVGDQIVRVYSNNEGTSGMVTDAKGHPIHSTVLYWFAWAAFHPDSHIYTPSQEK